MFKKLVFGALAPVVCLALFANSASAQSPPVSSYADNADEYYGYVYTYMAMVEASGLDRAIRGGEADGVAALILSEVDQAFDHCLDALQNDNDWAWHKAVDDLEDALFWTYTLEVFAPSHSQSIDSLQWRLELAIDRCYDAGPPLFIIGFPIWP